MKEAIQFFSVEAFCLASIGFSFKNQMKGMVAHGFPPAFRNFIAFFPDKNYCWRLIFLSANGALFTVFSWLLGGALNEYVSTSRSKLWPMLAGSNEDGTIGIALQHRTN